MSGNGLFVKNNSSANTSPVGGAEAEEEEVARRLWPAVVPRSSPAAKSPTRMPPLLVFPPSPPYISKLVALELSTLTDEVDDDDDGDFGNCSNSTVRVMDPAILRCP